MSSVMDFTSMTMWLAQNEDDFGDVAVVVLDVEDDLGLDDARVVEVEAFDLLVGVVTDRLGDVHVTCGDDDGEVDVVFLHGGSPVCWVGNESSHMVKFSPR